jgi:MHS family shikimate/dehydroshikimate transporter-like MFS transporter
MNAIPETATQPAKTTRRRQSRKVAMASLIGTTVEWYDFFLFGTAAALVFPELFFSDLSPASGLLASLASFGVGFVARPLGGAIVGHFGDRVGRKKMLVLTLLFMGGATVAMGLLPDFTAIGILAPILLVALRFIQGLSVGGEWAGAALMAVEHAPQGRRGFFGSWPMVGTPAGLVLSTAAFAAVGLLPNDAFLSWGWRLPFLLSAVLIVVGLVVRLRIIESPVFAQVVDEGRTDRLPIKTVFVSHWRSVIGAAGLLLSINTVFYLVTILSLSWATTELGVPRSTFLGAILVAGVGMCFSVPLVGALSDKIGRRTTFGIGIGIVIVMAFPLFMMIQSGSVPLIYLGVFIMMALAHCLMAGHIPALFSEMFPPAVRYTGASMGYQIGGMLGGLVPMLAASLLIAFDNAWWPLAALMAVIALVSLICLPLVKARYRDEDVHTVQE